jgi:hypothetical protein
MVLDDVSGVFAPRDRRALEQEADGDVRERVSVPLR